MNDKINHWSRRHGENRQRYVDDFGVKHGVGIQQDTGGEHNEEHRTQEDNIMLKII